MTTTKSIGVSSVQFLLRDNYISEKQNKPSVEARLNRESTRKLSEERRASLKPVYNSLQNINFEQIGKVEKKPALIAATNSVELIIKKGSVRHMKTPEEEEAEEEPEEVENYEKRGSLQISEEKEMSFSIIKNRCSADDSLYNKEMRGNISN